MRKIATTCWCRQTSGKRATNDDQLFRPDGREAEKEPCSRGHKGGPNQHYRFLAGLFLATEAGLRLFDPKYAFYSRTQSGQFKDRTFGARHWPRKDPDLGWILGGEAPDFFKPEGLEPPVYVANSQGFRDTKDFATIDYNSGKTRIMMLGDSFLFGAHLDAQKTISAS